MRIFTRNSAAAGEVVATQFSRIGERLKALDKAGVWRDAKVINERVKDSRRQVKVHFHGWNQRWDEWIDMDVERLQHLDADAVFDEGEENEFEVEKIVAMRCVPDGTIMAKVRWLGWPPSKDSWVFEEDLNCPELVDDFNLQRQRTLTAYVLQNDNGFSMPEELAGEIVGEWVDAVSRTAWNLLKRSREEFAARQLFNMKPCPPWLYRAIHTELMRKAGELTNGDPGSYVSAIRPMRGARGGQYVEDVFDITKTRLVEELVGEFNNICTGSLVFRDNGTAIMLVPPLEFKFKTKRVGKSQRKFPTELVVAGHFISLVDRKGPKGPR